MNTIRRLISAWILALVGGLLLPLVSLGTVSGTTHDAPPTTTTIPVTVAQHTVAIETVGHGEFSSQSMASGQVRSLSCLSRRSVAPKTTVYRGVNSSHADYAAQSACVVKPNNKWNSGDTILNY